MTKLCRKHVKTKSEARDKVRGESRRKDKLKQGQETRVGKRRSNRESSSREEASLTLPTPCISENSMETKINLNFYFCASLWCFKRFFKGL